MPTAALTNRQRLCLAVIVTVAAALRFETLAQTSLAHFDEGVLASSAFGVLLNGPYYFKLAQPLQSPPLFPWMVAAAHELTQNDWVIMGKMISAAFGTATVFIQFLLARRLAGNRFGLIAAALLALSDLHIEFSRMALTDAPLTFWFTLSIYAWLRLVDAAAPTADMQNGGGFKNKLALVGWTIFAGLTTGAAWNTKYNGWMTLAIGFTAVGLAWLRDRAGSKLPRTFASAAPGWTLIAAAVAAAMIAGLCFWPWYRFVERSFAGGYRAVTENHLSYFGGPAAWPGRAWQLWLSLTAFRHYGWLITLAAGMLLIVASIRSCRDRRPRLIAAAALSGLAAAVPLGADIMILLLAVAAIAPALLYGRWEQIALAVWVGSFVLLVPLYHPYARLIVPALPAAICLALWLVDSACELLLLPPVANEARAAQSALAPARLSRTMIIAAITVGITAAAIAHPFGIIPSAGLWRCWSTRHSYRALGSLIDEHTPADAEVLCQGLPPMPLYCPRRWLSLDQLPFHDFLASVPRERPCYLAVDDWGAHGAGHEETLKALRAHRHCLQTIAWTPNDLNIVTLLDNLSPWQAAQKLERAPDIEAIDQRVGQPNFLPPALQEMGDDVIVLYRVDRSCIESQPKH